MRLVDVEDKRSYFMKILFQKVKLVVVEDYIQGNYSKMSVDEYEIRSTSV